MRFLLVGGGARYEKVEGKSRNGLLLPRHAGSALAPFERMADLLQIGIRARAVLGVEGFPTTVLEAGMFGVPAVASMTIGNSATRLSTG